jgi:hypothetical protein
MRNNVQLCCIIIIIISARIITTTVNDLLTHVSTCIGRLKVTVKVTFVVSYCTYMIPLFM